MPDDLTDEMLKDRIQALLVERTAVGTSDQDRVDAINRELARFGYNAEPPAKRAAKRTTTKAAE